MAEIEALFQKEVEQFIWSSTEIFIKNTQSLIIINFVIRDNKILSKFVAREI